MGKYERYRHHAWAGLGFLSVFIAIKYFVSLPDSLSFAIVMILSIYIIYAIIMSYLYSGEMERGKEGKGGEMEKERIKLEKKRIKAELKAKKKEGKK